MNRIELQALKWLAEITGFREDTIAFSNNSSPDFNTPNGEGFEVKYCPSYPGHQRWSRKCTLVSLSRQIETKSGRKGWQDN